MTDGATTQPRGIQVQPLGRYLVYALVLHSALLLPRMLRPTRVDAPDEAASVISGMSVDLETAPPPPLPTPPGGGSPVPDDSPKPVARAPERVPIAKVTSAPSRPVEPTDAPPTAEAAPERSGDVVTDPEATVDQSTQSGMTASQMADERRDRDLALAAAAAAAGAGRGTGDGPGGPGSGWGTPKPIRGATAFGNGTHGALTGHVCFIPVGTTRIADVHHCEYVATVYTDTLNIPERQYFDGFPGVSNRSDWFLIDYSGTFTVSEYGWFRFRIHSDDGSYVYIDDRLVIENDGKHAPESRTGVVQLGPGTHSIAVRYAQTTDRMALQLFVQVPQTTFEIVFGPHI